MEHNSWSYAPVSQVTDIYLGGTPSRANPDYWCGDITWASAKDIASSDEKFIYEASESITQEGLNNSAAKILPKNTVVITARGTVGSIRMLGIPMSFNQTCYGLVAREDIDPTFLFYALKAGLEEIKSLSYGTVFDTITTKTFESLMIPLPPIPEQHAIAKVLGSLDDKIELNHRINVTLEAMARAVFKEWFVYNPDVNRWEIGYLDDIAYVIKGVSYRSADLIEASDTALVTLKSMERGGGYRDDGLKPYSGGYKPEQKITPGEVVIAHTDITQAADVIGRAARVETSEKHSNLVASLDMAIVRPKGKPYTNEYLYGLLSQVEFSDHAYGYTNGTTVLHLNRKALPEYQIRIPPKGRVEEFSKLVSPFFLQIDNNKKQSRTLTDLRDTLLPRLMRGEIIVNNKFRG
jgi:type I restriction enzyme S subunit